MILETTTCWVVRKVDDRPFDLVSKRAANEARLLYHFEDGALSAQEISVPTKGPIQSILAGPLNQLVPEVGNPIFVLGVLVKFGLDEIVPLAFSDHQTIHVITICANDVLVSRLVIV